MIVRIRLEVSDEDRRALRSMLGRSGLASRSDVTRIVLREYDKLVASARANGSRKPATETRPSGPVTFLPPDPPRTYTHRAICGDRVVSTCSPERDIEAWQASVEARYQEVA